MTGSERQAALKPTPAYSRIPYHALSWLNEWALCHHPGAQCLSVLAESSVVSILELFKIFEQGVLVLHFVPGLT